MTSSESAKIRELRRKNRELEQTIGTLKAATSFFVRECDPRVLICQFIDQEKERFGVAPICRVLSAHGVQIAREPIGRAWPRRGETAAMGYRGHREAGR